jgi:hypothetical protein
MGRHEGDRFDRWLRSFRDVDGDGVWEVLVGACDRRWRGSVMRSGRILCLSDATGEPLWELKPDDVALQDGAVRRATALQDPTPDSSRLR